MNTSALQFLAERLEEIWSVPGLSRDLEIEFSARMKSSLGRCIPGRRIIRLNGRLRARSDGVIREVFCHELAHLAVYLDHGPLAKPHGAEWQELVERAGYVPSARLCLPSTQPPGVAEHSRSVWYEHRCAVCQQTRISKASNPRWRCGECVDDGLSGVMTVTRIGRTGGKAP